MSNNFTKIFGNDDGKLSKMFNFRCVEPNKDLYYFYGRLAYATKEGLLESDKSANCTKPTFLAGGVEKEEVDLNSFLHRGAIIRNSGKVLALVVYTGTDTKLIKNFGNYKFKRPEFELLLNKIMFIQLGFFILSVVTLAIGNAIWNAKNYDRHSYIFHGITDSKSMVTFKAFWSYWLMMLSLIPLEAEASLQIAKLLYTMFVGADAWMAVPDFVTKDIK